jgi:hypothetical protein
MQTIEARTAQLKPLAALAGRLDLLIAHMPKPDIGGGPEQIQLPGPAVLPFIPLSSPTDCAAVHEHIAFS